MCFTGNGTTLGLSASGVVGRITEIGEYEFEAPIFEDDDLSSSGNMPMCVGDLATYTPMPVSIVFDDDIDLLAARGVEQTATLTTKPKPGQSTGAIYTGLGWITKVTHPARRNNERLEGGFEWLWKDGYTHTPGAA